MREILGRLKYYAAVVLFLLTSSILSVGQVFATPGNGTDNPDPTKVYVCKYVGTPGVDERLQTGQNPIDVSINAIKNFNGVGSYFNDAQGRSYVLAYDTGQTPPDVSQCPAGQGSTVSPTSPLFTTPTCILPNETITPPVITGVIWSPDTPTVLQPGQSVTYTAAAAAGYTFSQGAQTTYNFTNTFDPATCIVLPTPVTPQAPSVTSPSCGLSNELVTPVTMSGITWTPSTPTILQPGQSVTYTASILPGYVLALGAQTSFTITNNFDIHSCDTASVTLCHATDSRKNPYKVITVDAAGAYNGHLGHTGPIFSPSLPQHTKWGDIIPTFTYGGANYSLNWDAAGMAILNAGCKVAPTVVTPQPPTATTPNCNDPTETVTPPAITGIIWSPNHATTLLPGMSVTYKAKAAAGYVLAAGSQTHFTFKNTFNPLSCVHLPTVVVPTPPLATTPSCEVPSEIVTPPSIPGIVWSPSGSTTLQPGESVTYTASAAYGYVIAVGAQTQFTVHNTFQAEGCGGGGVTPLNPTISVTPSACLATVLPTGTATVTITNPNNFSVDYLVDLGTGANAQEQPITVDGGQTGQVTFTGLAAGTYTVTVRGDDDTMSATGSVTITDCPVVTPPTGGSGGGHVLGASTTITPAVASTVTELANTGTSVVLPTILAISLVLTATGVMLGDYMRRKSAVSDPTL